MPRKLGASRTVAQITSVVQITLKKYEELSASINVGGTELGIVNYVDFLDTAGNFSQDKFDEVIRGTLRLKNFSWIEQ